MVSMQACSQPKATDMRSVGASIRLGAMVSAVSPNRFPQHQSSPVVVTAQVALGPTKSARAGAGSSVCTGAWAQGAPPWVLRPQFDELVSSWADGAPRRDPVPQQNTVPSDVIPQVWDTPAPMLVKINPPAT